MKNLKAKSIEQLKEDLVDLKLAEDRLNEVELGKAITQTKDEFLKEMEVWVNE